MIKINLMKGDCLEKMKEIPDKSVDMVLTDPPYGTTACKWDSVIPFEPMWEQLKRIIKDKGAVLLFGAEPFSSFLRVSNIDMFKYDWIWQKTKASGHLNAKKMPMRSFEIISVFSNKACNYYPQGLLYGEFDNGRKAHNKQADIYGKQKTPKSASASNYPKDILTFGKPHKPVHPTQKPVPLLEYLIKTYTLENETVLDFTMGSGSTGVACKNLNRNFIGIERDEKYFEIAKNRIEGVL
jgi:DNA modification methylase